MQAKIKNDLYNLETLNIFNGFIFFGKNKYKIQDVVFIIESENRIIEMSSIYKKLDRINKKYKLKEYLIRIEKDFDNIEVSVDHTGSKIHEIEIRVGYTFIKDFTEDELLVYLAHEIGHIMDFDYTVKKNKYIAMAKSLGGVLTVLGVPGLIYYFNGYDDSFKIKLLISLIIWVPSYLIFLKYLKSFLSRNQEYNADTNAVEILGDVDKVIKAFYSLQFAMESYEEKSSIFSSHPSLNQRMKYLKKRYFYHYIWKFFFGN